MAKSTEVTMKTTTMMMIMINDTMKYIDVYMYDVYMYVYNRTDLDVLCGVGGSCDLCKITWVGSQGTKSDHKKIGRITKTRSNLKKIGRITKK